MSKIGEDWTVQHLLDAMVAHGAAPAVITFAGGEAAYMSYAELVDFARRLAGC